LVIGKLNFQFTSNDDGLIASFKDSDNSVTALDYKSGGELSEAQFPGGQTARYEYQPSGLRSRLTYQDKRRLEYAYDPVGNLLSTRVFDSQGKQVQGQTLTLNDSYQVTKRVLFDGTVETYSYDPNSNLVKHIKNGGVTTFEYDELDRLVAVLTPDGQHMTYSYSPGEHSIVEQYEHSNIPVADLRDTGFTFAASAQVMTIRPATSFLGAVRFSENLGTFQLANGNEIVTPDLAIEQPLHKLNLTTGVSPLRQRQNAFNRPFNPLFMPAEYSAINCCFSCSTGYQCRGSFSDGSDGSTCCPPCEPSPPTPTPPPGQPNHLLVLSDQTFTLTICPSTDVQNTQIRRIKYQIVDVNENPVIGAVSIREQFASKSAESCGTTVSTSETCTLANSAFVDNLTVGCNSIGGSCGHTYTRQTWQWCGPSTPLSIGTPGDIVVHNDLISVGGNFIFIPGTDIFP